MKKILIIAALMVLFGGALYSVRNFKIDSTGVPGNQVTGSSSSSSQSKTASDKLNIKLTKAIDFKLKDLDGKTVSLSDFKGKNVYLNFWASWCPPCKAEMPDIEKLYQETKDSDLVIIAVNLGEDKETVKSFINENEYHFKVLLDPDQSVGRKYNINAIPDSYFIDKNGNINSLKVGAMTFDEMRDRVKQLSIK